MTDVIFKPSITCNQYAIRKTNFILGDTFNDASIGVLHTITHYDIPETIAKNNGIFNLYFNIAILDIPASISLIDLISILKSTDIGDRLNVEFSIDRIQLAMQMDDIRTVLDKRSIDFYFAVICIYIKRMSRRPLDVAVYELIESIKKSMNSANLLVNQLCIARDLAVEFVIACTNSSLSITIDNKYLSTLLKETIYLTPQNNLITPNDDCCPICLELYDSKNILTLVCSHTFHIHCISQHVLFRCPICRLHIPIPYLRDCYYTHDVSEHCCLECGRADDINLRLLLCLVCGFIGCPQHSKNHFRTTSHGYGIELWGLFDSDNNVQMGQRIWSHATHSWVQRLVSDRYGVHFSEIESKTNRDASECSQELNALCSQFMDALSRKIEQKNSLHEVRMQAIEQKYSNRLKTLLLNKQELQKQIDEFNDQIQSIDKNIQDAKKQTNELKSKNKINQTRLIQVNELTKALEFKLFTLRHEVYEVKSQLNDLLFHTTARSEMVKEISETEMENSSIEIRRPKEEKTKKKKK